MYFKLDKTHLVHYGIRTGQPRKYFVHGKFWDGARTKPVVKVLWHIVFKNNSRITVISKSTNELEPHGAVTISPLAQ